MSGNSRVLRDLSVGELLESARGELGFAQELAKDEEKRVSD